MSEEVRIIFVDDEESILTGIERVLFDCDDNWGLDFANSGKEALEMMEEEPFDIIVSDMRMPEMDGVQLLKAVRDRFPNTVRIVLTGYADNKMITELAGLAHQFMVKPSNGDVIISKIESVLTLKSMLIDENLQALVSKIRSVPSLPSIYTELMKVIQSPEPSVEDAAFIIQQDPGLSAKVLQQVNSALFGMGNEIVSIHEAVSVMGIMPLQAILMTQSVSSMFGNEDDGLFDEQRYFQHVQLVSDFAKAMADMAQLPLHDIQAAHCVGLLHDVGELLLAANAKEEYLPCLKDSDGDVIKRYELECERLGTDHAKIGAYLLGLWGLPQAPVQAVAFHHEPWSNPDENFNIGTILFLAEKYEIWNSGSVTDLSYTDQEMEYLEKVEAAKRLPDYF